MDKKVYERIVDFYGSDMQQDRVVEELGELIQAIEKCKRFNVSGYLPNGFEKGLLENLKGELSDVVHVLNYLYVIYDIDESEIQERAKKIAGDLLQCIDGGEDGR